MKLFPSRLNQYLSPKQNKQNSYMLHFILLSFHTWLFDTTYCCVPSCSESSASLLDGGLYTQGRESPRFPLDRCRMTDTTTFCTIYCLVWLWVCAVSSPPDPINVCLSRISNIYIAYILLNLFHLLICLLLCQIITNYMRPS